MASRTRYCGYVRVSDVRSLEGYSIEAQKTAIQAYIDREGGVLVEWYIDEAISATSTRGRDEFHRMRVDAKRGLFDAVLVHKFDRLARNKLDAGTTKIMLRKDLGIKVLSATDEPSADSDPIYGALIENLMEVMHEWYSINLGQEVKKVRQQLLEHGKWYGQRPYGYQKNEETGILEPHSTEAPIVRWMFEEYSKGQIGFKTIALKLNEQGYRTVSGKGFTKGMVQSLLQSKTYMGMLRYQEVTKDANGKRTFNAPIQYFPGKHEPLCRPELFDKCQQVMKGREHNVGGYAGGERYLLQGLVYCSYCMDDLNAYMNDEINNIPAHVNMDYMGRMYGRTFHAKGRNKGQTYGRYMCRAENGHGGVSGEYIEKQLIDFLVSNNFPDEWKNAAVWSLEQDITMQQIQERVDEIGEIVKRMDYRFDKGFITDLQDYEKQRQALQNELDILKPKIDDSLALALSILTNFSKHWTECGGDFNKRRALINLIVARVYARDGRIEAVMLKPDYRYVFPTDGKETEQAHLYPLLRS